MDSVKLGAKKDSRAGLIEPLIIFPDESVLLQGRSLSEEDVESLRKLEVSTRGVMERYRSAMRQMEVRFEAFDSELNTRHNRNPIHHIESRLKRPASIFEKLQRYGKGATIDDMRDHILDIAGIRVICSYIEDVYKLLEGLKAQDDLEIVIVKDYIENPKPNGYRSLHAIVRVPVHFLGKKELVPVEVQFRTIAMDFWASLEHDLKYKAQREIEGIDFNDELKDCSRIIESVEGRMQILARALESE